jgi:hypothetical protein
MRFLVKNNESEILKKDLKYLKNRAKNNKELLEELIKEQKNYCAYTEEFLTGHHSSEVEHLNSYKKHNDNYFNYYAVLRKANLRKKDEKYKDAGFWNDLFFQKSGEFENRIAYVTGEFIFEEIDEEDVNAKEFIDFLCLNDPEFVSDRKKYIARQRETFEAAGFSLEQQIEYFKKHKEGLSFLTVTESELGLDLSFI